MRTLFKNIGLLLLVAISIFLMASFALAQEPEYVFRAGGSGNPEMKAGGGGTLYNAFKRNVEEYSDGKIRVDIYWGGALGGEREILESTMQGFLEISFASDAVYSVFEPKWTVMDLPYFFSSREKAWEFLDGEGGEKLSELMLAKGVRILAYGENSVRQISNSKREIRKPEDLKGLKIRLPETPAQIDWLRSLGAIPAVLPITELITALQQGVVDGQENGMMMGYYSNIHEFQKFWTDTNHDYSSVPIAINKSIWQGLPSDLQDALLRAAKDAAQEERSAIPEEEATIVQKLEEAGVKVTLLTPEERAAFEATAKPIWQKYASQLGEDFMDWAFALVGKEWR